MRFNERELVNLAERRADMEGRVWHRTPGSLSHTLKPRWLKLVHNLLFYYRLNEHGGVSARSEPAGLFVLENCDVRSELPPVGSVSSSTPSAGGGGSGGGALSSFYSAPGASDSCSFSITLDEHTERRHVFTCASNTETRGWLAALAGASYNQLRRELYQLRNQLLKLGAVDPLPRPAGQRALKHEACDNVPAHQQTMKTQHKQQQQQHGVSIPGAPERPRRNKHSKFYSGVEPVNLLD